MQKENGSDAGNFLIKHRVPNWPVLRLFLSGVFSIIGFFESLATSSVLFVSDLWKSHSAKIAMSRLLALHQNKAFPSNFQRAVYVWDRLNENSLIAAAILKRYASLRVMELGKLEQCDFPDNTEFVWLGFQPTLYIASRYKQHKHGVFLADQLAEPAVGNVRLIFSDHASVGEQVTEAIVAANCINVMDVKESLMLLGGIAFIVSQFTKHGGETLLVKKDRDLIMNQIALGYKYIVGAFRYLNYGDEWNPLESRKETTSIFSIIKGKQPAPNSEDLDAYFKAVETTKAWLSATTIPRLTTRGHHIAVARQVDTIDEKWYVAKRLHRLSGQVLRSPRVLFDHHYETGSNANEVFSRYNDSFV